MAEQHLSLNGAIVQDESGCYWLLEEATDLDIAWWAIVEASVSGSVGATSSEMRAVATGAIDWDRPSRIAKVRRLVNLSYTPQGVYGAHEDTVTWQHPVLTS